ncbi:unnamed protein product, partial [Urochloa humidicola]
LNNRGLLAARSRPIFHSSGIPSSSARPWRACCSSRRKPASIPAFSSARQLPRRCPRCTTVVASSSPAPLSASPGLLPPELADVLFLPFAGRRTLLLEGVSPARGVILASDIEEAFCHPSDKDNRKSRNLLLQLSALPCCTTVWLSTAQSAQSSVGTKLNMVYEVGELFELGIQLSYLLILLGLLGAGSFFVIRQVLVRRELDLSAKELQEQVRSGDANATEYFELGAVMLRRKFYPAAIKYLQQAIDKWDRDEQDLAQVYNALGVSYKRDNKLDKAIQQFEKAVKLQPGYVTAWNNLGDAYELKKDLKSALKAFEEVLLFDPNNKVARPRVDDLRQRANMYKGVPIKSEKR